MCGGCEKKGGGNSGNWDSDTGRAVARNVCFHDQVQSVEESGNDGSAVDVRPGKWLGACQSQNRMGAIQGGRQERRQDSKYYWGVSVRVQEWYTASA